MEFSCGEYMKFIFLDETTNRRKKDFYGICGISIDEYFYPRIAQDMAQLFKDYGWNLEIEFKGRFLFSISKGDSTVTIDQRIELANQMIDLNVARRNARLKAAFVWNEASDTKENHLFLIKRALKQLITSSKKSKLYIIFADQNDKIILQDLWKVAYDSTLNKDCCLVEDVVVIKDWKPTHVGLCLCDLIAYLTSWICLTESPAEAQQSLFEEELISSFDVQKAETVQKIFQNLKQIKIKCIPLKHDYNPAYYIG
jgi:hypothetical protein